MGFSDWHSLDRLLHLRRYLFSCFCVAEISGLLLKRYTLYCLWFLMCYALCFMFTQTQNRILDLMGRYSAGSEFLPDCLEESIALSVTLSAWKYLEYSVSRLFDGCGRFRTFCQRARLFTTTEEIRLRRRPNDKDQLANTTEEWDIAWFILTHSLNDKWSTRHRSTSKLEGRTTWIWR